MFIARIKNFIKKFKKVEPRCECYCSCGSALISNNSFLLDHPGKSAEENVVIYECKTCGKRCYFNFDLAPVPISWHNLLELQQEYYPNGFDYLLEQGKK